VTSWHVLAGIKVMDCPLSTDCCVIGPRGNTWSKCPANTWYCGVYFWVCLMMSYNVGDSPGPDRQQCLVSAATSCQPAQIVKLYCNCNVVRGINWNDSIINKWQASWMGKVVRYMSVQSCYLSFYADFSSLLFAFRI